MATPSMVEIAPRGDVVLALHNDVKLRVQSQVLALASPVFKAMLDQPFQEGSQLACSGFVEIPLPDDDPLPTQTVCQVLHFQFDILAEHLSADDILDIAIVIDKYGLTKALSCTTHYWISRLVNVVDDGDRARLFFAAYLLNHGQLFRQLSYELVMKNSTDVASVLVSGPEYLQAAYAALQNQRVALAETIGRRIEDTMKKECKGHECRTSTAKCARTCFYTAIRGAALVSCVGDSDLLPLVTLQNRPLTMTCASLRTLAPNWEAPPPCEGSFGRCIGALMWPTATTKVDFAILANITETEALRMCLKCVQKGDIEESGVCKKDHST